MLKHLHIRNLAVIEELEIELDTGMTVFTGETGAGKSIIVDALGLVLGDRADSSVIRAQCDNTEITAIFEICHDQDIQHILDEQEISYENELMLRRVINRDGRSRAFVNGSPMPVQMLKQLGEQLVDIHGQHAHQSLMKKEVQRMLLDEYGQHESVLGKLNALYQQWHDADTALSALSGDDQDRDAKLSLLQYQLRELEALNLSGDEIMSLDDEFNRLSNISKLLETSREVLQGLSDDDESIHSRIIHCHNAMKDLVRYDNRISTTCDLLDNATIQITEAVRELGHYCEGLELDPERLKYVEARINDIHDIARKHKVKPEVLPDIQIHLQQQLNDLQNSEERLLELQANIEKFLAEYRLEADKLHTNRVESANKLSRAIENRLKDLGMPGGQFTINVDTMDIDKPRKNGMDNIEFLVSINPGQPLKSIRKVASGGELSRISLAIQVIGSKDKGIPTLIFDEVDAGIGGGVAEIVGQLLHSIAENRQVFCVTHLAQVAAYGDHHLQVNKSTHAGTTLTQVLKLENDDRIEEIARMLGGLNITEQSRAHAREMLSGD